KLSTERIGVGLGHFTFQHDVTPIGVKFFGNLRARKFQFVGNKIDSRIDIVETRRVGDDRFDRDVVRQDFVVGVEDRAALGEDRLLDDVLFSSQPGVLVVLDHLQVNQAKRKQTEDQNETEADDRASCSAVPF